MVIPGLCLKVKLINCFLSMGLIYQELRGRCYGGSSKKQEKIVGIKILILVDMCVHLFTFFFCHQL